MDLVNLFRNYSSTEVESTDYYLEKLLKIVQTHESDNDNYKSALIKRMISTIKSIKVLRENVYYLETPVLLRVTFESAARLYQYTYYKSSVSRRSPDAFKILGRSPGPNYAINRIGEGSDLLKYIYRFLCSFAHPDVLSLILSLEDEEKNKTTIDMISRYSIIGILYVLSKVYPGEVDETDLASMTVGLGAFILNQTVISTQQKDNIEGLNNLTEQGIEVFADDFLNEAMAHLAETLSNSQGEIGIEEVLINYMIRSIPEN